jgi:NAD(P)H-nitrite reductase large subunit
MGRPAVDHPILCTCFKLTGESIRKIIDDHRCTTVEDVAEATGACRGCQTCRPDIEALLKEAASRR